MVTCSLDVLQCEPSAFILPVCRMFIWGFFTELTLTSSLRHQQELCTPGKVRGPSKAADCECLGLFLKIEGKGWGMQVQLHNREAMESMGVTGSVQFFLLELWPYVFLHNSLPVGGPM